MLPGRHLGGVAGLPARLGVAPRDLGALDVQVIIDKGIAKALAQTNAVAERLGSICVAQANRDSQKGQKLSEMKGQDAWERGRSIEKLSWAIMPGDEKPDSKVADACAKLFTEKDFIAKSDSAQIAR